jgi:hypothetical protein
MPPLDFPNAPTVGQIYPVPAITGVPTYTWDGTKWLAHFPLGSEVLLLSGGTMTGDIVLAADPDLPMEPATKQYTDARVATAVDPAELTAALAVERTASDAAYHPKTAQLFAGIPLIVNPTFPYTLLATDAQKGILGVGAVTIPANSSVPFPVGTVVSFHAYGGNMTVSIAAGGDTLYWNSGGTLVGGVAPATRSISNVGLATAIKVTTNSWVISGNGIT